MDISTWKDNRASAIAKVEKLVVTFTLNAIEQQWCSKFSHFISILMLTAPNQKITLPNHESMTSLGSLVPFQNKKINHSRTISYAQRFLMFSPMVSHRTYYRWCLTNQTRTRGDGVNSLLAWRHCLD